MQIVNLDIVDTRDLLDSFLTLKDLSPFCMLFEEAGYDTSNFIIELGSVFFIIIGTVLYFGGKALLKIAVRNCEENWIVRKIRGQIHYTAGVIRFFLEGCLELGFIAMLCVKMITAENFSTFTESLSICFAFVTLACLVVAPVKLAYEAYRLRQRRNESSEAIDVIILGDKEGTDEEENPYAEFFADFKHDVASMAYVILFFLRRYCMVLIMILLPHHGKFQISAQISLTMLTLCYLIAVKPRTDRRLHKQEYINEGLTLLAAYPLLTFTGWV